MDFKTLKTSKWERNSEGKGEDHDEEELNIKLERANIKKNQ